MKYYWNSVKGTIRMLRLILNTSIKYCSRRVGYWSLSLNPFGYSCHFSLNKEFIFKSGTSKWQPALWPNMKQVLEQMKPGKDHTTAITTSRRFWSCSSSQKWSYSIPWFYCWALMMLRTCLTVNCIIKNSETYIKPISAKKDTKGTKRKRPKQLRFIRIRSQMRLASNCRFPHSSLWTSCLSTSNTTTLASIYITVGSLLIYSQWSAGSTP